MPWWVKYIGAYMWKLATMLGSPAGTCSVSRRSLAEAQCAPSTMIVRVGSMDRISATARARIGFQTSAVSLSVGSFSTS